MFAHLRWHVGCSLPSAMQNSPDQQPQPPQPHSHPFYPQPSPGPSYPPATPVTAPATDVRARNAGIALLAAAGVTLIAVLSKAWFTADHEVGVGLLGIEKCRRSVCQGVSWFDAKHIPAQIPIFATMGLVAALVAVALLVHAGVMLLQNRPASVKLKWISQLVGITSGAVTGFVVALSFGDWSRGLHLGWSTFLGYAGIIGAGAVMGFMVRPLIKDATSPTTR
jgi:hypothetical protein